MSILSNLNPFTNPNVQKFSNQFNDIKDKIQLLIKFATLFETEKNKPGHYWGDANWWADTLFSKNADWVFDNFRMFVNEVLSGNPFGDYSQFKNKNSSEILEISFVREYLEYARCIPEQYMIKEPKFNTKEQFGVNVKGMQISASLTRHQRYIANLYAFGCLDNIAKEKSPIILEIGAGYGMLADSVLEVTNEYPKYIIIDIPPLLALSATYLAITRPNLKQSIFDLNGDEPFLLSKEIEKSDIIFIPHFASDCLYDLPKISLALNTFSFQEMSEENIHYYSNIISDKLVGVLYSDNFRRHPHNFSLKTKVGDILREYFYVYPNDEEYYTTEVERKINYMWQTYVHFGTSRKRPYFMKSSSKLDAIWGEKYNLDLSFTKNKDS